MDEYERVASEYERLIMQIPDDAFVKVVDSQTTDEDCRSAQTISSHVVRAAYGYAGYIREQFNMEVTAPRSALLSRTEALEQLKKAIAYTVQTLDGRWEMTDEEADAMVIKSRWGVTYDLTQLLEHAIVHLMRHRRQLEKFISQDAIICN